MTPADRRFSFKVVAWAVGVLLAGWVGLWLMGWDDAVHGQQLGCATRPYADLPADQLPCMFDTGSFDGQGHAHLSGVNPGPATFTAGTFHVPNPDQWLEAQTETLILPVPPGPFDLTIPCEPGAAQVDLWLDTEDEAYVAATTLNCGAEFVVPVPVEVPADDTAAAVPTDVRGDDTATTTGLPLAPQAAVSGGQEQDNPSAGSPAPAPASTPDNVGVAGVSATRTLAATGAPEIAVFVGAAVLLVVFGLGFHLPTRKAKR